MSSACISILLCGDCIVCPTVLISAAAAPAPTLDRAQTETLSLPSVPLPATSGSVCRQSMVCLVCLCVLWEFPSVGRLR